MWPLIKPMLHNLQSSLLSELSKEIVLIDFEKAKDYVQSLSDLTDSSLPLKEIAQNNLILDLYRDRYLKYISLMN